MLHAARLCDQYGMDTISTGGTLAWAMECGEKGLLPEAEKFGLASAGATVFSPPSLLSRRERARCFTR